MHVARSTAHQFSFEREKQEQMVAYIERVQVGFNLLFVCRLF